MTSGLYEIRPAAFYGVSPANCATTLNILVPPKGLGRNAGFRPTEASDHSDGGVFRPSASTVEHWWYRQWHHHWPRGSQMFYLYSNVCRRTVSCNNILNNHILDKVNMLTGSCLCAVNKYTVTNVDVAAARKVKNPYFRKKVMRFLSYLIICLSTR